MSNIRSIKKVQVNTYANQTVPKNLVATRGYIIVHVPLGNYAKEVKLSVAELFALPGIVADLPTTAPATPGSLWNDGGVLKIS